MGNLDWVSDGQGIVANTREAVAHSQLEYIPYRNEASRRITTDPNSYWGVSLTADNRILASVQERSEYDTWVVPLPDVGAARPIASGGSWGGGTWTPQSKIVLTRSDGSVWTMDANGANLAQLTLSPDSKIVSPRASPDGRYIAFLSDRGGRFHVWRISSDGNNPKQLTSSQSDGASFSIDFTPDSRWVVYSKEGPDWGIWKVPIDGGEPVRLNNTQLAQSPAISPDGKYIAYVFSPGGEYRVAVMALDGSEPEKRFNVAAQFLAWTRDSRAVLYVRNEGGVSNIWRQQIAGDPATQITHFTSELVRSFDLSPDGKQLVLNRGTTNRDVVLIRDVR